MKKWLVVAGFVFVAVVSFLAGQHGRIGTDLAAKRALYYVDPMHPSYRSDNPGVAPDCGMELEAVYEGEQEFEEREHSLNSAAVRVSGEKRQLVGVQVETLKPISGAQSLTLTGRVVPDENTVYRVLAGTDGQVRSLGDNASGAIVKRDEVLATIFTSEFLRAQQTFIFALKTYDRVTSSGHDSKEQIRSAQDQLDAAEGELRTLGMSTLQIQDLSKKRELTREIRISSPASGVVLSRNVTPDQRIARGDELYRIANLDRVWILADLPEGFPAPAPGAQLRVNISGAQKTVKATVSSSVPLFDNASRTLKLRLEAHNPGLLLRPDMFVEVEATAHPPRGNSIPRDAIIDNGRQKVAYIEVSDGIFEPRKVELGPVFANRVIVKEGLKEGDRVVTSGNFLIDSETRMREPGSPAEVPPARHDDHAAGVHLVSISDPVCGMALSGDDLKAAKYSATHDGRTLVFCSEHCLKKFRKEPAKYVKDSGKERAIASSSNHGGS